MKITGPGSGTPPAADGVASGVDGAGGKSFADKLDKSGSVGGVAVEKPISEASRTALHQVASELQAGKITPEHAVDRVVHLVLDQQLGADAPVAIRNNVEAALRNTLETDPMLADRVRKLAE
jgi:hypothetical protein